MLLLGILSFVSTLELEDQSSTISMALMVLGTGLFLWGIFRIFWRSKLVIYAPTGSIVKEGSLFFNLKYLDGLKEAINTGNFSPNSEMRSESSGNLRMDIIISEDHKFVAVQLFQFIPYTYQAVTPVRYFTDGEASAIAAFLAKSKQP